MVRTVTLIGLFILNLVLYVTAASDYVKANFDFGNHKILQRGKTLTLTCINNLNNENIVWKFNTSKIESSRRSVTAGKTSTLTIKNARDSDAGDYICGINYQAPDGIRSFIKQEFKVIVEPKIEPIKPVTTTEGQKLVLVCNITSVPSATVVWSKNGKEVKSNDHMKITTIGVIPGPQISELSIKNVARSDRGKYSCIASNIAKSVNETSIVDVYETHKCGPNDDICPRASSAVRWSDVHVAVPLVAILLSALVQH